MSWSIKERRDSISFYSSKGTHIWQKQLGGWRSFRTSKFCRFSERTKVVCAWNLRMNYENCYIPCWMGIENILKFAHTSIIESHLKTVVRTGVLGIWYWIEVRMESEEEHTGRKMEANTQSGSLKHYIFESQSCHCKLKDNSDIFMFRQNSIVHWTLTPTRTLPESQTDNK